MLLHWQGVAGEVLLLGRCSGARFQPGSSLMSRLVMMVVMVVVMMGMGKVRKADLAGSHNKARWLLFPLFARSSTAHEYYYYVE